MNIHAAITKDKERNTVFFLLFFDLQTRKKFFTDF
jgi:hypothetical protein